MDKKPRIIKLIGNIDEEAYLAFDEALDKFEQEDGKSKIFVDISSGGGSAYDALAFYSRIRLSPCDICITAFGIVASAAVLVLAAGDFRRMTRESWVMVHEDAAQDLTAKVTDVEKVARHMRDLEDQWNKLLADSTSTDEERWEKLHKEETYLSAKECLKLGLIEEII